MHEGLAKTEKLAQASLHRCTSPAASVLRALIHCTFGPCRPYHPRSQKARSGHGQAAFAATQHPVDGSVTHSETEEARCQ